MYAQSFLVSSVRGSGFYAFDRRGVSVRSDEAAGSARGRIVRIDGEEALQIRQVLDRATQRVIRPGLDATAQLATEYAVPIVNGTFNTVQRKDSFNFAVGWDANVPARWLNPRESVFLTTQVFWRHIFDYSGATDVCPSCAVAFPVPEPNNAQRVVPLPQDTILQTDPSGEGPVADVRTGVEYLRSLFAKKGRVRCASGSSAPPGSRNCP